MTKHVPFLIAVLLLAGNVSGDKVPNVLDKQDICGTWVRTQKTGDGESLVLMKIITPTHFAVFQQDSRKRNANAFQAHSGTYRLEKGAMVENYEFSSSPAMIGRTGSSRLEIKGKILRQTWTQNGGLQVVEEWQRALAADLRQNRDA